MNTYLTVANAPRFAAVTASVLALAVSGCGMSSLTSGIGGGLFSGGAAGQSSAPGSVTNESLLTAAKGEAPAAAGAGDVATGCPRFTVFSRDSNVTIYEAGRVGDPLGVMHRGEVTKTARECNVEGGRVTVKYGFSGRVLLGPRGKTGNVQLPVTVFVTDAKRDRIVNDRMKIDVPVGLDKPIGYFSTIREVTFTIPEGARAGEFELFVGFERNIPNAG